MVLPSFYEGLPLVAIKALAMEKPVVATAVDGTPEVVLEGKTGLTVPPGDPAALGKAIGRLLADSALRRILGKAGRRYVLDNFTEERQVAPAPRSSISRLFGGVGTRPARSWKPWQMVKAKRPWSGTQCRDRKLMGCKR